MIRRTGRQKEHKSMLKEEGGGEAEVAASHLNKLKLSVHATSAFWIFFHNQRIIQLWLGPHVRKCKSSKKIEMAIVLWPLEMIQRFADLLHRVFQKCAAISILIKY